MAASQCQCQALHCNAITYRLSGSLLHHAALLDAGTLPTSWADNGSFPALTALGIEGGTKMSGILPPEWGSPAAFQQLQYLYIVACTVTGTLQ